MWVWIAVGAIALIILVVTAARLLGRLPELRRAAGRLQRRQAEAMGLQAGAARLEQTLQGLQQRAERAQEHVERIKAGSGH
ncbi:hypothetical protein ACWT_5098 [Actinoplanes sp. SE50]|uniref:hypothetical protein n=1 Tax=unclassified Actinoplanes TaxID=2626549 RepID=UPI00023ED28D|nr:MULTISPECIES: hypothetical protein [unclassified Actinoplanes]AEV86115.1 hypothetical protein ACPL_5228 [Actinoplanes sp. SE50/110]ATO84513.1 hypothetical protein ACWT_5098 [Actinoplanes sp. SE50]SLM01923.1 uncharacterized protein ACSP50_5161 [Actinoplanes sp. SE50/110]